MLEHIKNVRWQVRPQTRRARTASLVLPSPHSINSLLPSQFADVVPDYIMGSKGTAALYISLRYHLLNPTYLLGRLKELQNAYVSLS